MTENLLERHVRTRDPHIPQQIDALIELAGGGSSENFDLYRELLRSAVQLIAENATRWDAKIATAALSEMVNGFGWLRRFERRRKCSVFGSARTQPGEPDYTLATEIGRRLAQEGFMVITGAGAGAMQAANEGAGPDDSLGFNITLPFEQEPNRVMADRPGLMAFRFFFTRKLFFIKESDAIIVLPGGFGTADELFEALTLMQTGKTPIVPIVLIDHDHSGYWDDWLRFVEGRMRDGGYISKSDTSLYRIAHDAESAIALICRFYSNYHSMRWIDNELRLRIAQPLEPEKIEALNREFADIIKRGAIVQAGPHEEEQDEPELLSMSRLAFEFDRRGYGRLRELIAELNNGALAAHCTTNPLQTR
ncbi:MAG: TIGR00730 family Rossman fold protein [Chromatiales bacterium]|nr:TIGR00730 family Rossman fold protein [Chromatiales bacterium]